jgi:hypothetical protein
MSTSYKMPPCSRASLLATALQLSQVICTSKASHVVARLSFFDAARGIGSQGALA